MMIHCSQALPRSVVRKSLLEKTQKERSLEVEILEGKSSLSIEKSVSCK